MNDLIHTYHKSAQLSQVNPDISHFPSVGSKELDSRRQELLRLFTYANRLARIITPKNSHSEAVCLLLDGHGCVIHSYKTPSMDTSRYPGTNPGDIWDLSVVGPNAITIGMTQNISMRTAGEENYNRFLQPFSICYSPITVMNDTPPHRLWIKAGIAFLLPDSSDSHAYFITARTIAHDLMLNLHLYQMPFLIYKNIGQSAFAVQIQKDGTAFITHYDDLLFDMFHVTPGDYYLRPASDLIDPLPENRRFWDIITNMEDTNNMKLSLSIQKERRSCILSSWRIEQPGLGIKGMDFVITTEKLTTANIASKIGNQALRSFDNIVGASPVYWNMLKKAQRFSATNSNVMLIGESGAGKDVIAQAIHNNSSRRDKPFIAVNCAAIPKDLLTSELFGYESGAFTGAKRHGNIGKFELADGGTLFLDEIGELPLDLQASLLRIVEQKQFMRLGGNKPIDVDVKIISATNANIPAMIQGKTFRADLFYRLSTMSLEIPPLRERGEDIILLAEYFVKTISKRIGRKDIMSISPEAKTLLLKLQWPGNVRELQNLIERIVQLYTDEMIEPKHIYDNLDSTFPKSVSRLGSDIGNTLPASQGLIWDDILKSRRKPLTKESIVKALAQCNGSRTKAAEYLGISRNTLYRYIDKYRQ